MKQKNFMLRALGCILLMLGFLCFFAARWENGVYGDISFNAILFTLMSGLNGVDPDLIKDFTKKVILPVLVLTVGMTLPLCHHLRYQLRVQHVESKREIWISPVRPGMFLCISIIICAFLTVTAAKRVKMDEWLRNLRNTSALLETEYVSPQDASIAFPEKKRNLIYIFAESLETTMLSEEEGGAMQSSRMSELAALAEENVNFSQQKTLGGWGIYSGTTWTTAGIVSQMSGTPLMSPFEPNTKSESKPVLPNLTMLWDVLYEAGYRQEYLMGSDSDFSDMYRLMTQHGIDTVYDEAAAKKAGLFPELQTGAWGYYDEALFAIARQETAEMAQQGKPFALYINTIDTHFPDGDRCRLCQDEFDEQYENVYACASRQIAELTKWLQQQPFYKDTAIVICGDHLSMDREYFERVGLLDADRRVFNCFINAAAEPHQTKNREMTPFDCFPTTLAALGCTIEGERLGLGVNLFSDVPTLAEKMGAAELNDEIDCSVLPFMQKFMLVR